MLPMLNLLLDTSTDYLFLALVDDLGKGESYLKQHQKQHAELILPEIERLLNQSSRSVKDITSILVTIGPGSFTGIRLALTVAKLMGYANHVDVYALSTLQAYAPIHGEVILTLDARANRYYVGHYHNQLPLLEPCILEKQDLESYLKKYLSAKRLDLNTEFPEVHTNIQTFLSLKKEAYKVKDIHALTPFYLKTL